MQLLHSDLLKLKRRNTVIAAARYASALGQAETLEKLAQAGSEFRLASKVKFQRKGEW